MATSFTTDIQHSIIPPSIMDMTCEVCKHRRYGENWTKAFDSQQHHRCMLSPFCVLAELTGIVGYRQVVMKSPCLLHNGVIWEGITHLSSKVGRISLSFLPIISPVVTVSSKLVYLVTGTTFLNMVPTPKNDRCSRVTPPYVCS